METTEKIEKVINESPKIVVSIRSYFPLLNLSPNRLHVALFNKKGDPIIERTVEYFREQKGILPDTNTLLEIVESAKKELLRTYEQLCNIFPEYDKE